MPAASTQATLHTKVLPDSEAVAALLSGVDLYVRDPFRVRSYMRTCGIFSFCERIITKTKQVVLYPNLLFKKPSIDCRESGVLLAGF
jgi:hypothetical protein